MKNKLSKAAVVGMILGSILLTGCSKSTEAPNTAPEPTVSASVSASPTNTPVEPTNPSESISEVDEEKLDAELEKKLKEQPLGIDIDAALKNYSSPEVAEYAKKNDVKAGIKTALSFYQDLIYTSDFYKVRDASKDFDLINVDKFTDRMDYDFLTRIEKDIEKNGKFGWIVTGDKNASLGYANDKDNKPVDIKLAKNANDTPVIPTNTFNTPAISVNSDSDSTWLTVRGTRLMEMTTVDGKSVVADTAYYVSVIPAGNGDWKVSSLGWKLINKGAVAND